MTPPRMLEPPALLRVFVSLTDDYEDDALLLRKTVGEMTLWLTEGAHEAVMECEAGLLKATGERLAAHISVPYYYHALTQTLDLCGNDMADESSPTLALRHADGRLLTAMHPYEKNCNDALRAEQHAPLHQALCAAWDEIKDTCVRSGVRLCVKQPPSEELERMCALYYNGVLMRAYDPDHDDFDPEKIEGIKLAPLTSVVPGTFFINPTGWLFANVVGSSGGFRGGVFYFSDKPTSIIPGIGRGTSWKRVWEIVCGGGIVGSGNFCACMGVNHVCTPLPAVPSPFNNPYVGGHIVWGAVGLVVQFVPVGGVAQIIPICKKANANPILQLAISLFPSVSSAVITNFLL